MRPIGVLSKNDMGALEQGVRHTHRHTQTHSHTHTLSLSASLLSQASLRFVACFLVLLQPLSLSLPLELREMARLRILLIMSSCSFCDARTAEGERQTWYRYSRLSSLSLSLDEVPIESSLYPFCVILTHVLTHSSLAPRCLSLRQYNTSGGDGQRADENCNPVSHSLGQ